MVYHVARASARDVTLASASEESPVGIAADTAVDLRSQALIDGLDQIRPRYVLELPSSTLKAIVQHFFDQADVQSIPIPREEEGVGILGGLELAGQRAVMIIQDNGIGNMLTALTTFPQAYHVGMLILVSRRGGLGEYNSMIHYISDHAEQLLDAAGIGYFQLDGRTPIEAWAPTVVKAYEYAHITHRPILLLVNLMGG